MRESEPIARWVRDKYFAGGLTYSGHPLACAAAMATLDVYDAEGLFDESRKRPLPLLPRAIGIVTSMMTAIWISRALVNYMYGGKNVKFISIGMKMPQATAQDGDPA